MNHFITILFLAVAICSCQKETINESATKTENESDKWIYLFDGTSTDGWRAYNGGDLPPGWIHRDGTLTFDTTLAVDTNYQGARDIIYGLEEFENFELYLEWKLPEGGNSCIFYHLKEGYNGPPEVSPEYQLIDDLNYTKIHNITEYNLSLGHTENPSELQPLQQTASDYAMYPADPKEKILHPIGDWNSTTIIFTADRVEHWLNGKMVLSFVPWSKDWNDRKNSGKWKEFPDYGKFKAGYIGLQDHGSSLWFKNIKIKKL